MLAKNPVLLKKIEKERKLSSSSSIEIMFKDNTILLALPSKLYKFTSVSSFLKKVE